MVRLSLPTAENAHIATNQARVQVGGDLAERPGLKHARASQAARALFASIRSENG